MQKISKGLCAVVMLATLHGCASINQMAQRLEASAAAHREAAYRLVEDPALVGQIYTIEGANKFHRLKSSIADEGFHLSLVEPWGISLRKKVADGPNEGTVDLYFRKNRGDLLALSAVDIFLDNARKRGSTVKMYRPVTAFEIARHFKVGFYLDPASNTRQWYDTDEVLVEYAPDGRVLAFVTRSYQSIVTIGAALYEHLNLYYGAQAGRLFQNQLSRRFLMDNEIRTL